jgi:glycolate oxidase FAD binding subunit
LVFRLHPVPAARRWVSLDVPEPAEAAAPLSALAGSQVVPTAVEIDLPPQGSASLTVLLEGTESGVDARAAESARLLPGARLSDAGPRDFGVPPFTAGGTALKLTTVQSGVARLLVAVRETAARRGIAICARGSAVGVLYAGVPASSPAEATAAAVEDLRKAATAEQGSLVVLTAPAEVCGRVDRWGPVPGLALMRRVKDEMDRDSRLAPGRFVGGI